MKEKDLKREIGVWGLSSNLVNNIIGAGIFVLPAIVAAGLGSASILAYLLCGLLIALVMLCFAEVGSKITNAGGVYAYIEVSFGKYFGFLTAILFIVASVSGDAAIANAITDIVGSIFPLLQSKLFKIIFFVFLFSGLGYINVIGVKKGIGLVKFITIAKLVPLLILILFGLKNIDISNLVWENTPSIQSLGEISLILFFAFQGAESSLSVSGEVRNPKKTVPTAIRNGILIVLVFYILIQTVSQGVLGDSLSGFKENPLGEVARKIIGPVGLTLLTLGAAASIFGTLSSVVLSLPRILFGAAKDKILPFKKLSLIHKKFQTPYVAIITYVSLGFLFATFGGFKQLAILSSASILLIYLGVSIAVIKLRKMKNTKFETGTFKIPGGPIVPVLSSLVIIWFLSNLSKNEFLIMLSSIVFLTIIYFVNKIIKSVNKNQDGSDN